MAGLAGRGPVCRRRFPVYPGGLLGYGSSARNSDYEFFHFLCPGLPPAGRPGALPYPAPGGAVPQGGAGTAEAEGL